MITDDTLTIVVPAYNTEGYLKDCVLSLCAQTYPLEKREILIIDDGSTDQTGNLADFLAKTREGVRVIHQENRGLSGARNRGIREAKGAYIGFVDSDDKAEPQMYEMLMDAALANGDDIVQCGRTEQSVDGRVLDDVVRPPEEEVVIHPEDFLESLLMHEGEASFCTKIVKRELFTDDLLFAEGRLNEDFELLLRMLPRAGAIRSLPERLYIARHREGSISRKRSQDAEFFPPVFEDIIVHADEAQQTVDTHYPQLAETAMRFALAQRLDYLLHIPIPMMNDAHPSYPEVCRFLREHRPDIRKNRLLTKKERRNLLILSYAPRLARRLHVLLKGNHVK
ncbi:MAG: glycosyltransferase family 2 protein [Lachnospiraceae bacterium]|nr:glycosyltransferase family 2 protein [Lachnospiraceae bacterium]